ncbi:MAG: hypothetical protein HQL77_13365 [Magnetococcales bacterium]|nr:hypothetical protein [Magnetococcales bacterium]
MEFDLNKAAPAWLALVPSLQDILKAVDTIQPGQWHERLAELLDFAYRVRFARIMMNHPSTEEMEALALHLEDIADDPGRAAKLDAMEMPYASRWRMLRNVLEDRLAVRELPVPEIVSQRRKIRDILEILRKDGRLSQQQLENDFQWADAELSRILGLLEGWELVMRDKMAKEQWLFLGPRAGEVISLAEIVVNVELLPSQQTNTKQNPQRAAIFQPAFIPNSTRQSMDDVLQDTRQSP